MKGSIIRKRQIILLAGMATYMIFFVLFIYYCYSKNSYAATYHFNFADFTVNSGEYDSEQQMILGKPSENNFAESGIFNIPDGNYDISISYISTTDCHVWARYNNDCTSYIILPSSNGEIATYHEEFILENVTDRGKLHFSFQEQGYVILTDIVLKSDKLIYTDYKLLLIMGILFSIILFTFIFLLIKKKVTLDREQFICGIVLFFLLIIINIFYLNPGLPLCIDIRAHLLRIEGIRSGLADKQFPVIINPNYCNGFGELGVLYPGALLYIPAFLRLMDVSMLMSYKCLAILINVISIVSMYFVAKSIFHSKYWATLTAVLFGLEPYRLYCIQCGYSAGTGIAIAFLPFVIGGIYHILFHNKKYWYWLAIGLSGAFCSHILTTFFAVVLITFFCLINIKRIWNRSIILCFLKALLLFVMISLGGIIPFIRFYFSDWNREALMWSDFYSTVISLKDVLNEPYILMVLLSVVFAGYIFIIRIKETKNVNTFYIQGLFYTVVVYLMTTAVFPWKTVGNNGIVSSLLKMIQYSDRMLSIISPLIVILLTRAIMMIKKDSLKKVAVLGFTFIFLCGMIMVYINYNKIILLLPDEITGDINSKAQEDYLPSGTKTDYYATDTGYVSDETHIQSINYSKRGTHINYQYTCTSEGEFIEVPLFYYMGYKAFDSMGNILCVEKGNRNRVRVYIRQCNEPRTVSVYYHVDKIYTISTIISLISVMGFLVFISIAKRHETR